MDFAPYLNNARDLKLILLGGITGRNLDNYHDWEFILRKNGPNGTRTRVSALRERLTGTYKCLKIPNNSLLIKE